MGQDSDESKPVEIEEVDLVISAVKQPDGRLVVTLAELDPGILGIVLADVVRHLGNFWDQEQGAEQPGIGEAAMGACREMMDRELASPTFPVTRLEPD